MHLPVYIWASYRVYGNAQGYLQVNENLLKQILAYGQDKLYQEPVNPFIMDTETT